MTPAILLLYLVTLLLSVLTIVMTAGIVWRVEKRLDISFKFILIALCVFLAVTVIDLLVRLSVLPLWIWLELARLLFIICMTIGIWEMRALVRRLDGEIPPEKKPKK